MTPENRILKKNLWCESDEQFIETVKDHFDRWVRVRLEEQDQEGEKDRDLDQKQYQDKNFIKKEVSDVYFIDNFDSNRNDNIKTRKNRSEGSNKNIINNGNISVKIRMLSIPKIFHFIWLGSELPVVYNNFIDSWRLHHPQWIFNIWNDKGDVIILLVFFFLLPSFLPFLSHVFYFLHPHRLIL